MQEQRTFDNTGFPNLDNAKILLVDDDNTLRAVTTGILGPAGYRVSEAADCTTGLELLKTRRFDVVLLDITLPDRSGFDILEFVSTSHLPCKVIMVTGTTGLGNAIKSLTLGADDYITKPYHPHYLLTSIRHVLSAKHSKENPQHS